MYTYTNMLGKITCSLDLSLASESTVVRWIHLSIGFQKQVIYLYNSIYVYLNTRICICIYTCIYLHIYLSLASESAVVRWIHLSIGFQIQVIYLYNSINVYLYTHICICTYIFFSRL
jgi:hypothetical protein